MLEVSMEKLQNQEGDKEIYENFRKEILVFKDLPESTFSDMRGKDGRILELDEAKKAYAHRIIAKINNYYGDTSEDKEKRRSHYELINLFEKEILGSKERKMFNEDGSDFLG